MQMMGTLLFFIIVISSDIPLLSPAPIPSTSSMIITRFCTVFFFIDSPEPLKLSTCEPVTSPSASPSAFLDRASEAFSSRTSRPDSRATRVAVVVFPLSIENIQNREQTIFARNYNNEKKADREMCPSQVYKQCRSYYDFLDC